MVMIAMMVVVIAATTTVETAMIDVNWGRIPERMQGGIERYIERGIPPGSFLQAVIRNDLRAACERADDENQHLLYDYVKFFYVYAPFDCFGSPENYKAWIAKFEKAKV